MTESNDRPTPDRIFQTLSAYWASAALTAGIRLGLFGALSSGPKTAEELGTAVGAPARSVRMLADALAALGLLVKSGETYANAPDVDAFLDPAKPTFVGGMAEIFDSTLLWTEFGRLTEIVWKGGTLLDRHALTPEHEFWEVFARHTMALAIPNAHAIADALPELGIAAPTRILDVACGTGGYGYALGNRYPEAHVTFVDWPNVLERTRENGAPFGLGDRAEFRGGDLFEVDLGNAYDLVVLANIHHHFDEETNVRLNRRVREVLKPDGAAVVVDFIAGAGRVGDPMPLLFSLVMLAWTPKGDTLTEEEYRRTFEPAGFGRFDSRATPSPQRLFFARP